MEKRLLVRYKNVDLYQQELLVLQDINLEIRSGEFIYLLGKVGSGKSTLMKSFYSEVMVHSGNARVLDYDLSQMKRSEIPYLRRKIGIVFQDFQLLHDRTVNDNLEFVLKATGWKDRLAIEEQIDLVLQQVGMSKKGYKMPHQLSGGEQQRIVIARALLNNPEMILADEPTGNLDIETSNELIELLHNIRHSGTTVIMATHNLDLIKSFPGMILRIEDGYLKSIEDIDEIDSVKVHYYNDKNEIIEENIIVDDETENKNPV